LWSLRDSNGETAKTDFNIDVAGTSSLLKLFFMMGGITLVIAGISYGLYKIRQRAENKITNLPITEAAKSPADADETRSMSTTTSESSQVVRIESSDEVEKLFQVSSQAEIYKNRSQSGPNTFFSTPKNIHSQSTNDIVNATKSNR